MPIVSVTLHNGSFAARLPFTFAPGFLLHQPQPHVVLCGLHKLLGSGVSSLPAASFSIDESILTFPRFATLLSASCQVALILRLIIPCGIAPPPNRLSSFSSCSSFWDKPLERVKSLFVLLAFSHKYARCCQDLLVGISIDDKKIAYFLHILCLSLWIPLRNLSMTARTCQRLRFWTYYHSVVVLCQLIDRASLHYL